MIFGLLGHSKPSSRLAAFLCLFAGLIAVPMMEYRDAPPLTAACFGVVAAGLPAIYFLIRRCVELGRPPELSELFASR